MAKYTVYGLPGVYNATPLSLNDGDGVALAVDHTGTLLVTASSLSIRNLSQNTDAVAIYGSDDGGTTKRIIKTDAGGAIQVDVEIGDTIGVTQSTSPWVVSGTVAFSNSTIAVTNAGTFAVQATLAAETTKVIGTVNQGTSPWVISGAVTEATLDAALISQEATTSGVKGLTMFGAVTTNAPSYTTLKSDALSLDTSGLLRISLKDTPANTNKLLVTPDSVALPANQSVNVSQINGVTVSMGTGIMGTGVQRVAIASDNDALTVKQATGTNLHVVVDTAPSTAVTNAGTFAVQATLQTQTDTVMVGGVNIKEINAVAPLMGNGITGTGSQRVTIASDNTAFSVNATLSAETTKVIGVVRNSDGAGNLWTSNSTTYTAKFAQDSNLLGTLGTAFTDAGKVNVQGGVATNVAITDKPLNLGAQAVSSENAAVTTARQVQLVADLVGKLIVLPYANPENFVSGAITSAMTGTTSTSLIAAPAAGLRNYITQITVSNSHATVGTDVIIQDGSGGTTLYTIPAAAAYGGASITFPVPLRQPTTATAIFCANVTTGSNIKISASGYKGA